VPDVAESRSGSDLVDAPPHCLAAHGAQALGLHRRLAHEVHAAGIAVEAVLDHGDVDIEDVAALTGRRIHGRRHG
jgi:hypothetical protein